jgi:hypothetical protein
VYAWSIRSLNNAIVDDFLVALVGEGALPPLMR